MTTCREVVSDGMGTKAAGRSTSEVNAWTLLYKTQEALDGRRESGSRRPGQVDKIESESGP